MELARALEELYGLPPQEFTARRDAIVKECKAAGDKESATQVAKRRKPTQVAYVLNQLARRHPDEVAQFVDVGRDLARAHRRALRGEGSAELTKAIAAQRVAVKELTQLVGDVVRELAADGDSGVEVSDATLAEVAGALQAALVDPAAGAALEQGQLERAPEASSLLGFGVDVEPAQEPAQEPARREATRARPARRAPSSRQRPRAGADVDNKAERDEARAHAKAERERAKAERAREKEQRAALMEAAERADALARSKEKTAKELSDEADRLMKAAEALAEQARLARDEAARASQAAREAHDAVPKARRVR